MLSPFDPKAISDEQTRLEPTEQPLWKGEVCQKTQHKECKSMIELVPIKEVEGRPVARNRRIDKYRYQGQRKQHPASRYEHQNPLVIRDIWVHTRKL